jgi:oligopeptidase B
MRYAIFFLVTLSFTGCQVPRITKSSNLEAINMSTTPPVAARKDHAITAHGHSRNDPYYWMNDRESDEVIGYLNAENAYTETSMASTKDLQKTLFDEIVSRIKQDDSTVPYFEDGAWYYQRYVDGGEYPIFARRLGTMDAAEQILVDGNARAAGKDYFSASSPDTSSDDKVIAWAEDHVGRRIYTIFFKDLKTGELLPDRIEKVTGNLTWALDGKTLFYGRQDEETLRSDRIYKHVLGTDPADDTLVFEETDDTFYSSVSRTKDKKYLVIGSYQTVSAEFRILDASTPDGEWTVFQPRERDHEHSIDHRGNHWYVLTNNDDATNFKLMKVKDDAISRDNWEDVIAHRKDVFLADFDVFTNHLILTERSNALPHLRVMKWDGSDDHMVQFDDPAYMATVGTNPSMDSTTLRFNYTSPTTPWSVFDYDLGTRDRTLRKESPVLGGFDKTLYKTERLWATAKDGTKVPMTLVYRKDIGAKSKAPTVLYGYGSYGATIDPTFNSARLSLLDRGFVWAIAHIRGSQTMGRPWYEDGKLLNKMNTFTDFIACGEYLKTEGWAGDDTLYAMGGSAGGLLMGAVINLAPDLWDGAVAAVPFVDVVTTMLDDTIPLTTFEYDEWGNPNDKTYYDYMLSYSPYDNIEEKAYPALLVTSGLHDSQVQYWEPTKWVAKLRKQKTNDSTLLLHTNMDAGHGGKSGRFARYHEVALEYAFLLKEADLAD